MYKKALETVAEHDRLAALESKSSPATIQNQTKICNRQLCLHKIYIFADR